jgi:hypothetical protein
MGFGMTQTSSRIQDGEYFQISQKRVARSLNFKPTRKFTAFPTRLRFLSLVRTLIR